MEINNRKKHKLLFLLIPVAAVLILLCAVIFFPREKEKNVVTLHFLMFGDKPDGMERVLEEFYQRTKDTLGIRIEMEWSVSSMDYRTLSDMKLSAGGDYDLVFDARWMHLEEMQRKGVYADLSPYFNNPDYPGLYAAFSETVLNNNLVNGEQCAFPIFRTYGSGIPCIYYRKDLADKYGVGLIESEEELKEYLEALLEKEPDMIPLILNGNRGFYNFSPQLPFRLNAEQGRRIVYPITIAGVSIVAQLNEALDKVEAVGAMGLEESFSGFMEGLQFDFLIGRLDGYRKWNKYCEKDVLNQRNQKAVFQTGMGGAYISTLDDYENLNYLLTANLEDAKLGAYIINESVREMEERSISTSYLANNYICIPASSQHIEQTIRFLDWLFASKENHDLFEYGIEGVHWKAIGEERYEAIADENGNYYLFPGYALTWNSHYVRFRADMPEEILAYKEYELLESTFYEAALSGFSLDESGIQSQMARVTQVIDQVWPALVNGMLDEPEKVLQKAMEEAKENGVWDILDEVKRQLQEYLDQKR